jgi:hypothetical protein
MTGLVLSRELLAAPFARWEAIFSPRQSEAGVFYDALLPSASTEDHRILRHPLMQKAPTIAFDLPLKVLVWQTTRVRCMSLGTAPTISPSAIGCPPRPANRWARWAA